MLRSSHHLVPSLPFFLEASVVCMLLTCDCHGFRHNLQQHHQQQHSTFAPFLSSTNCGTFLCAATTLEWTEIERKMGTGMTSPAPLVIDSALDRDWQPPANPDRPTLFRERHGWCPYSERVWLALELGSIEFDTVLIDNTGHGPRPGYFGGQTPQILWPDGTKQGESLDLVRAIDEKYNLNLTDDDENICSFANIFPRRARPSSRAAFLFQFNGEPLMRSTFEQTLEQTDELLASLKGPLFGGSQPSIADICWTPFLERYRYQLPCLHEGLCPDDTSKYPHLAAWYTAMDNIPVYACRVKGNAASWAKVLRMAGFGNAGISPKVAGNMEQVAKYNPADVDQGVWDDYASGRDHALSTPGAQASRVITRNREAILVDTLKNCATDQLNSDATFVDKTMRELVLHLISSPVNSDESVPSHVAALAQYLDDRMCVPRDMGAMSAACIRRIAEKEVSS